jgi:MFS family permease
MVVELLGSRIIGPTFGVSLFIWTSLITVTLVSLALGYWLGGKLADHKNSPSVLFTIILIAGLFLLLVPLIKGFVIANALFLDLRFGSLLSSSILFGPPLFLLGMVSPYIVKLSFEDSTTIGKTVGWLYAISTAGSVVGTVFTGFLLIPMGDAIILTDDYNPIDFYDMRVREWLRT